MTKGRYNPPKYPSSESAMARCNPDPRREGGEWSESTLTGGAAQSGRYSAWSTEEGEYDRVATEKVNWMFRRLNRALYDGRESGSVLTDTECREWSMTFPHLHAQGDHLLDVMDDGTELVDPLYREDTSTNDREFKKDTIPFSDEGLVIIGRHIDPVLLHNTPEEEALMEEIIAKHGVLEEYIAIDRSSRERTVVSIQSVVMNQLMDILWSEVASILQPLVIITAKDRAMKAVYGSRQTSLATSHSTSPYGSNLRLSHRPPLGATTHGPSSYHNPQFYENKPATSGVLAPPMLPRLTQPPPPPLSGLMHIRPVSLRRRNMSLLGQNERMEDILTRLSTNHHHNPTTTSHQLLLPEPLPFSRIGFGHNNPNLPTTPPSLATTAGTYRGSLASRTGPGIVSRRPQQLRPIENPRTPALERMDLAQIRGYRLPVNATVGTGFVGLSPPPTAGGGVVLGGMVSGGSAHVRNTQLPPLEIGGGSYPERSPPVVVRGKSTFSNRNHPASNVALSELQELRRLQLANSSRHSDLRPNTSSGNFRIESGKIVGAGKKIVELSSRGSVGSGMKVVGHATGVIHSTSATGVPPGVEGGNCKISGGLPYSIAEDDESEEASSGGRLNVTGHSSAFIKSKPRSLADTRGKHRGHGR